MKYFKNSLTAIAMIVGCVVAFAFNAPDSELANTKRYFDPDTQSWTGDITGDQLGVDYLCTDAETDCVAKFDESGQMVPGTLRKGIYKPISEDEPEQ